MEAYEIDPIKIEKEKAMRRYRTFRKIANFVKTLEVVVAVSLVFWFVSWSSAYVPCAVNLTSAFSRRVLSLLFSPHFVFIIGNVIVITLFIKSGDLPAPSSEISAGYIFSGDVQSEEEMQSTAASADAPAAEPDIGPAEEERELEVAVVQEEFKQPEEKTYRRTKSSVEMIIVKEDNKKKKLRRSETEPRRKIVNGESAATRRRGYDEDGLSDEELRRKAEAFIEKQHKFHREESKAVVLSNECHSL